MNTQGRESLPQTDNKRKDTINKRISFDIKTDDYFDEGLETRADQKTAGSKSKISYYDFTNETLGDNANNSFTYSGVIFEK